MLYFKYILWLDHHTPQHIVFNTPLNKYLATYSQIRLFLREILNAPAGQNGSTGAAPRNALTIQTATAGREKQRKEGTPQGYDNHPPCPLLAL